MRVAKFVMVIVLGGLILRALQQPPPPPADPWFQAAVIDESRLVLVEFGASWCGPCQKLEPVLDDLEQRLSRSLRVVRVDIDEKPELAEHYQVQMVPRLFLFQSGKLVGTRAGYHDRDQLERWIGPRL